MHGLDKKLLRSFRKKGKLTLDDWLRNMLLAKSMVVSLGLNAADFVALGWVREPPGSLASAFVCCQ
eukprot:SAG11_NODE_5873_length_1443_cov_2.101935_1_plen_66_part_00